MAAASERNIIGQAPPATTKKIESPCRELINMLANTIIFANGESLSAMLTANGFMNHVPTVQTPVVNTGSSVQTPIVNTGSSVQTPVEPNLFSSVDDEGLLDRVTQLENEVKSLKDLIEEKEIDKFDCHIHLPSYISGERTIYGEKSYKYLLVISNFGRISLLKKCENRVRSETLRLNRKLLPESLFSSMQAGDFVELLPNNKEMSLDKIKQLNKSDFPLFGGMDSYTQYKLLSAINISPYVNIIV